MNYRHAFHAGNFADLVKHATLTALLDAMLRERSPLRVVDTHAGAGAYDLSGALAGKTREAEAGVVRLLADPGAPAAFDALKSAVTRLNPGGGVRLYPGSPLLIAAVLRKDDRYLGCELRPDDQAALAETLRPFAVARALLADGYAEAAKPPPPGYRQLVVIDPPFERPDDYERILDTTAAVRDADPSACLAAWLPLKDLETFDSFLRHVEDLEPGPVLVAQARLRPLNDPLKMNGCAMVLVNPPSGLEPTLGEICSWVAQGLGGEGAVGRVATLDA